MATPPDDKRLGRAYAAPEVTVFYDRGRCRHYAECVRGLPQVFDPTRRPWIRADLADAQAVAEVVRRCPTGALHYRLPAEEAEEPTHPTTIAHDPRGPLLVRGDLVVDTPEGPLRETLDSQDLRLGSWESTSLGCCTRCAWFVLTAAPVGVVQTTRGVALQHALRARVG
jgi:uncharacterized Fe-S cluster protein YjdI